MKHDFKNIGIVIHPYIHNIFEVIGEVVEILLENKINVYLDDNIDKKLLNKFLNKECKLIKVKNFGKVCDLVLSFGGDGTILSIAKNLVDYDVPLLGINRGSLAFLAQTPYKKASYEIHNILKGNFLIEKRALLYSKVYSNDKLKGSYLALNEVACTKGAMGQLIELEIFIDKEFVCFQRSDGIIISTPTGSTAYSLAAGGPIIQPNVDAVNLVPICPQSMGNRPVIVKNSSIIELLFMKGMDAIVTFDGHEKLQLKPMDKIIVKKYKKKLIMLNPLNYSYFKTLRKKLRWGEQLI